MNVMVVSFKYEGMSEAELRAASQELAPSFAHIPGCYEKTWLLGTGNRNIAGGVYKFRDPASLDAYLTSDLWDGVKSTPQFSDFDVRVFDVIEGPTAITGGMPATAAIR